MIRLDYYRPRMREGNVFILSVCCVSVCVSARVITFECLDIETSFWVWQYHIQVKFEYQGHWVKVKVTLVKLAFWTVGHQIYLLLPAYGTDVVIKVKVISW